MIGMRNLRDEPLAPNASMNAMVDIAFLLLIFFLVATTLRPEETDLPLAIPPHRGALTEALPLVITVLPDGGILWGDGEAAIRIEEAGSGRGLPALVESLRGAVSASGPDRTPILLRADGEAKQQRVIDVLDALAAAGVSRVAMEDRP